MLLMHWADNYRNSKENDIVIAQLLLKNQAHNKKGKENIVQALAVRKTYAGPV